MPGAACEQQPVRAGRSQPQDRVQEAAWHGSDGRRQPPPDRPADGGCMSSSPVAISQSAGDAFFERSLADEDPEIYAAIRQERDRQDHQIELIASENITSPAVLEAQGSVLTNKYAEGYPGRRYYGGFEYLDVAEPLGIERER